MVDVFYHVFRPENPYLSTFVIGSKENRRLCGGVIDIYYEKITDSSMANERILEAFGFIGCKGRLPSNVHVKVLSNNFYAWKTSSRKMDQGFVERISDVGAADAAEFVKDTLANILFEKTTGRGSESVLDWGFGSENPDLVLWDGLERIVSQMVESLSVQPDEVFY